MNIGHKHSSWDGMGCVEIHSVVLGFRLLVKPVDSSINQSANGTRTSMVLLWSPAGISNLSRFKQSRLPYVGKCVITMMGIVNLREIWRNIEEHDIGSMLECPEVKS